MLHPLPIYRVYFGFGCETFLLGLALNLPATVTRADTAL